MFIQGDAGFVLKGIRDNSIDCVVTSPPYWALRDYKVDGQLGLEPTFQEYLTKLLDIFTEIKRILKKSGTCWVVLGDTYSSVKGGSRNGIDGTTLGGGKRKITALHIDQTELQVSKPTIEEKSLCMIPQRFAIGMIDKGWILRNDIIWHKPNCMPSSATDRFTVDYEHIFFFVKSQRYYFKTQYEPLIREPHTAGNRLACEHLRDFNNSAMSRTLKSISENPDRVWGNSEGRIKRTVWKIPTQPFPDAHFAVFPEELVKTPIIAGCPEGGLVLDPFAGSGTTLLAAHNLFRNWLGIEINPDYIKIAKQRLTPLIQQQRLELWTTNA